MPSHASPSNSDLEKKKKIVSTVLWKKSKANMWYGFAAVIAREMIMMTGFPQFPLNKV